MMTCMEVPPRVKSCGASALSNNADHMFSSVAVQVCWGDGIFTFPPFPRVRPSENAGLPRCPRVRGVHGVSSIAWGIQLGRLPATEFHRLYLHCLQPPCVPFYPTPVYTDGRHTWGIHALMRVPLSHGESIGKDLPVHAPRVRAWAYWGNAELLLRLFSACAGFRLVQVRYAFPPCMASTAEVFGSCASPVPCARRISMCFNAKPGIDHRRCSVPCVQSRRGATGAGLPPPLMPSSGEKGPLYPSMGIHA